MVAHGDLTPAQHATIERIWAEVLDKQAAGEFGSRGALIVFLVGRVLEELPFLADDSREVQQAVAIGRAYFELQIARAEGKRDALSPMRLRGSVAKLGAAVEAYGKLVKAEALARGTLEEYREHRGEPE